MAYQYYLLTRPPGIGCQPEGFSEKDTWLPKRFPIEFARGAFGIVTYPKPLSFTQIDTYDLFPLDSLQQAVYVAWLENDKVPSIAEYVLDSYWQLPDQELMIQIAKDDYTALDIKRLKDSGYTWYQVVSCLNLEAANV